MFIAKWKCKGNMFALPTSKFCKATSALISATSFLMAMFSSSTFYIRVDNTGQIHVYIIIVFEQMQLISCANYLWLELKVRHLLKRKYDIDRRHLWLSTFSLSSSCCAVCSSSSTVVSLRCRRSLANASSLVTRLGNCTGHKFLIIKDASCIHAVLQYFSTTELEYSIYAALLYLDIQRTRVGQSSSVDLHLLTWEYWKCV